MQAAADGDQVHFRDEAVAVGLADQHAGGLGRRGKADAEPFAAVGFLLRRPGGAKIAVAERVGRAERLLGVPVIRAGIRVRRAGVQDAVGPFAIADGDMHRRGGRVSVLIDDFVGETVLAEVVRIRRVHQARTIAGDHNAPVGRRADVL